MNSYIVFLRGINVGGQKKIKMIDLKTSLKKAGFKDLQTYIQSGNLVIRSNSSNFSILEKNIYNAILKDFDFKVPILITTPRAISEILAIIPFKEAEEKNLYFTMLHQFPDKELVKAFNALDFQNEDFRLVDKCVYLNCKKGAGKAKLNNNLIERKLKVTATTRNLRTMQKMIELAN